MRRTQSSSRRTAKVEKKDLPLSAKTPRAKLRSAPAARGVDSADSSPSVAAGGHLQPRDPYSLEDDRHYRLPDGTEVWARFKADAPGRRRSWRFYTKTLLTFYLDGVALREWDERFPDARLTQWTIADLKLLPVDKLLDEAAGDAADREALQPNLPLRQHRLYRTPDGDIMYADERHGTWRLHARSRDAGHTRYTHLSALRSGEISTYAPEDQDDERQGLIVGPRIPWTVFDLVDLKRKANLDEDLFE